MKTKQDDSLSTVIIGHMTPLPSDVEQYDRHVKQLQKHYHSRKWAIMQLSSLLDKTASLRQKWIVGEHLTVQEISMCFHVYKSPNLKK